MRVAILSSPDYPVSYAPALRLLAEHSRLHEVVDEPEFADLVLYPDCHIGSRWSVRRLFPTVARFVVYDERDLPRPDVPGIYTSLRRSAPPHCRPVSYLRTTMPIERQPLQVATDLYGFRGGPSSDVRWRLAQGLSGKDGTIDLLDKTYAKPASDAEFVDHLASCIFVLCPKGHSPSSYRIFEAMAAGRVPVIIADEWVPPDGPDWGSFSLQIPESQIDLIPQILRNALVGAPEMAVEAHRAFSEFFAPEVTFDHFVHLLSSVGDGPRLRAAARQRACGPYDARWTARQLRRRRG